MNNDDIQAIEARIGYKFDNKDVLVAAFTHSSYVNEHEAVGNERIEFLGDCVLNFLVGSRLFDRDPTAGEGVLSARRASLVSRAPLARLIDNLDFMRYLQVGAGVDKTRFSDKARSDLFEAIIGAVYKDGGIDACKKVLENIFFGEVVPERDYKSELKEYGEKSGIPIGFDEPVQNTNGLFDARVTVGDNEFFGTGVSKRDAQAQAVKAAYEKFILQMQ